MWISTDKYYLHKINSKLFLKTIEPLMYRLKLFGPNQGFQ